MALTLYILTQSEWGTWLPSEIQNRSDATRLVYRAEQTLVDRYTEEDENDDIVTATGADTFQTEIVMIEDWEEDANDNPDTAAMPDDLVTRLRDSVARIVTHRHESPDGHVQSKSVGSRSVSYKGNADNLPHSVYEPLRPYDDRTPYGGAV